MAKKSTTTKKKAAPKKEVVKVEPVVEVKEVKAAPVVNTPRSTREIYDDIISQLDSVSQSIAKALKENRATAVRLNSVKKNIFRDITKLKK